jgi:hypothetical protein
MATDGTNWEVGLGTYTLGGTTLARTTILASSNANAAVNWAVGTRTVSLVLPAAYLANGGGATGSPRILSAAGSYTATATDAFIISNLGTSGTIALALPAVSVRAGLALRLCDWAGNATINVTPNGAETIMGLASASLQSSGQGAGAGASLTLYPSAALSGWLAL